jgi:DNA polymerase-3 subunit delta
VLYLLSGEDDFSFNQYLEEIKTGIGDRTTLEVNTSTLDGREVTLDQLRSVCETAPFFSEKRLVIVNGLLERFEPRRPSNRKAKTARLTDQREDYKSFSGYIVNIPPSTTLVLVDGQLKSNNSLFKEIAAKAEVKIFPPLRDIKLRQWIQRRVTEEGGTISSPAIGLLARLVGSNLWTLASEINKLVMFASGRRIEEEDVDAITSSAQEASVFAMVDAIIALNTATAEQLLHQLLQRGVAPAQLLVMLTRQVRMMVQGKELKGQGKPANEVQNKLGLSSEFALRKTLEQADKYSWERLKEIYHRLLEADLSIKTGRYDGELALNILLAELCQPRRVQAKS